ncbi:DUF5643 domain-containing protein [Paenibacillus sp. CC-CFT747]|nr:DUF5643 domain-containing protein [Paenibacillus sp. CC-CFT747]
MDEHTYAGVINLTPETWLPEHFEVTMTVSRIGGKEGKWAFTFPVRRMTSTNTVVMPMKTQSSGDLTLTVRKIVFTPSSTELDVQIKQPKSFDRFINYDLVDEQGVVFERRSGGGGGRTAGDFEIADFKQLFGPAQKIPQSVTVRPVIEGGLEASVPLKETRVPMESAPDEEHPLVLSQGETGQLKITRVEFLKDKTLVHYQTEGSQPFLQSTQLWMEDETGRKYLLLDRRTETVDPGRHMFLREFPAFRPNQKLTFVTRELPEPNYAEGLEMIIPIQK